VLAVLWRRAQGSRAAGGPALRAAGAGLACGLLLTPGRAAHGAELGQVDGFDVRWDTTLRDTLAFRTMGADPALLDNINADDGDRAFGPGLISARLDLYSELTAVRGDFGIDLSAQGWYDPVYFQPTANNSPKTFNPIGVSYDHFPPDVRGLMGADAELVNAFVKDRFNIGDVPVSVRVGRQTLLWGESLFFADNGIAAGQAPVDSIKAMGAPLAEARELFLPVTQAVVRVELQPGVALEMYDQFEWRQDRLPGVASYFSTTDILDVGGDRVLVPSGNNLYRTGDSQPHGIGQFGAALRVQGDAADYGLYALRYDAKLPETVFDRADGTYQLVYPRGIDIVGASTSTYLGNSNVAAEISWRHHMPLAASNAGLGAVGGAAAVYAGAYSGAAAVGFTSPAGQPAMAMPPAWQARGGFATGDTWHAQTSIVSQLAPSRWWQGASLEAEAAMNDLLGVTGGHNFVLAGRTHFAASLRAVFTPNYFQVLPGLDIGLPIGIGYTPIGRSSIDSTENAGAGDVTVGVAATYRAVWQGNLSFTHFIGGPSAQVLEDRDFATVSVTRSL
jgi:hypothetical protein